MFEGDVALEGDEMPLEWGRSIEGAGGDLENAKFAAGVSALELGESSFGVIENFETNRTARVEEIQSAERFAVEHTNDFRDCGGGYDFADVPERAVLVPLTVIDEFAFNVPGLPVPVALSTDPLALVLDFSVFEEHLPEPVAFVVFPGALVELRAELREDRAEPVALSSFPAPNVPRYPSLVVLRARAVECISLKVAFILERAGELVKGLPCARSRVRAPSSLVRNATIATDL